VDADFVGNWDTDNMQSWDSARSRHGYFIKYNNCLILWKSQMAMEITMSSTESKYIGASCALRDVFPIMELLKEMQGKSALQTVQRQYQGPGNPQEQKV
jgi:hypothetical protein